MKGQCDDTKISKRKYNDKYMEENANERKCNEIETQIERQIHGRKSKYDEKKG